MTAKPGEAPGQPSSIRVAETTAKFEAQAVAADTSNSPKGNVGASPPAKQLPPRTGQMPVPSPPTGPHTSRPVSPSAKAAAPPAPLAPAAQTVASPAKMPTPRAGRPMSASGRGTARPMSASGGGRIVAVTAPPASAGPGGETFLPGAAVTAPPELKDHHCPSCRQPFDDPRVLQCFHVVCIECLRRKCTTPLVHCPLCDFVTKTFAIERLPRDVVTEDHMRKAAGKKSCRNCGELDASVFCRQCNAMLCGRCDVTIHRLALFQRHTTTPVKPPAAAAGVGGLSSSANPGGAAAAAGLEGSARDPAAIPKKPGAGAVRSSGIELGCMRHGQELLTSYCATCRQTVCKVCIDDAHRGHQTQPLTAAYPQLSAAVPTLAGRLDLVAQQSLAAAERVREAHHNARVAERDCAMMVDARFDALVDMVNARRKLIRSSLAQQMSRARGSLAEQYLSLRASATNARLALATAHQLRDAPELVPLTAQLDVAAGAEPAVRHIDRQRLETEPCVDASIAFIAGTIFTPVGSMTSLPATPRTAAGSVAPLRTVASGAALGEGASKADKAAALKAAMLEPKTIEESEIETCVHAYGRIEATSIQDRKFVLRAVGDHMGVLYYLGTNRGIRLYENPATAGRVRVASSSLGYGRTEHIVSDGQADFCTDNVPDSWVEVALDTPLQITHYTLYHDTYDKQAHFLRSWELHGWRDDDAPAPPVKPALQADKPPPPAGSWDVLTRHRNDATMCAAAEGGVWEVPGCRPEGYKRFRLVQTGPNSSGNHFMLLSGWELYGTLLVTRSQAEGGGEAGH